MLMEHPFIRDRHVVMKVHEVTPKTVLVYHHRYSSIDSERRKRSAVIGIFKNQKEALASIAVLETLTSQLYQAEKAAKAAYNAAVKALVND